jgi:LacI family transcriptional regulator
MGGRKRAEQGLGTMAVTIEDVARRAGVSRGTVSNVLNSPEIVLSATRERVLQAMRELDFVPNQAARALGGARNRSIGLVIHDVGNPFFAEMARGVEDVATPRNYVIMLTSTRADDERQRASLRSLMAQRVAGVLVTPTVSGVAGLGDLRDAAVVLLDQEGAANQCSVAVDDVCGGRIAAEHLLSLGRSRLAFVGGPRRVRQHTDRLSGMRTEVAAAPAGVRHTVRVVPTGADTVAAGEEAAKALLAKSPLPTGVFCANDLLAIGLIRVLCSHGIGIPDDIAVVGYDNTELASLVATPITSIRQPMYEMGRRATELLLAEIHERAHRHQHLRYVPELVVRASTTRG